MSQLPVPFAIALPAHIFFLSLFSKHQHTEEVENAKHFANDRDRS